MVTSLAASKFRSFCEPSSSQLLSVQCFEGHPPLGVDLWSFNREVGPADNSTGAPGEIGGGWDAETWGVVGGESVGG